MSIKNHPDLEMIIQWGKDAVDRALHTNSKMYQSLGKRREQPKSSNFPSSSHRKCQVLARFPVTRTFKMYHRRLNYDYFDCIRIVRSKES